jgi:pyruvyl transferase EpsO
VKTTNLINNLQNQIDRVLRPLLSGSKKIALLDFPNHPNIGDSAIWLGELTYLRSSKFGRIVYTCSPSSYSATQLSKVIGEGAIVLSGGGNFGDLWQRHQSLREQVILDFPNNPIIQLPQSICFQDTANLERAKSVVNRHRNVTLLMRDQKSLDIARDEFKCPSFLCPDMAFSLGQLNRPCDPFDSVVFLAREDKESNRVEFNGHRYGIKVVDWLDEGPTKIKSLNSRLRRLLVRYPGVWWMLGSVLSLSDKILARQRVHRGCEILAQGRFIVTDRLHGHILSILLNIPHIVLDNSYGKVSNFFNMWTKDCDGISMSNSFSEAYEKIKAKL